MAFVRTVLVAMALAPLAACGSDTTGDTAPAAPSGLTAEPLGGGAHLTWSDNSDNETEFMVMRMEDGVETEYQVIATVPFDTEQYHDAPLTSGTSYVFMIMAMNDAGEADSNEVTFDAP